MSKKNQSERLTTQHKDSAGVIGIFGKEAKEHDVLVSDISKQVILELEKKYPDLKFRYRQSVLKKEINTYLNNIDARLGQTLFVEESNIKPDGGIIEVKDDNGKWRIVLVSEAKHQGKDIENIEKGVLVGKDSNQDLMVAGNAIERSHKNITEIANFMLGEIYFPYVLFLEGSNFLTHDVTVKRPDGRAITLRYNSGALNRMDRLTSSNYGMPINTNLCKNITIELGGNNIMLQAASIYTSGNGRRWNHIEMFNIMLETANTSIKCLASDLFTQLVEKRR